MWWSYKTFKAVVKSSPPTNQRPVFCRPDALPVTQPTVSEHWREVVLKFSHKPISVTKAGRSISARALDLEYNATYHIRRSRYLWLYCKKEVGECFPVFPPIPFPSSPPLISVVKVVLWSRGGGSPDEARLEQTPYPFHPH